MPVGGVAELVKCAQLESVNFSECSEITDAGVAELVKCSQLKSVDLSQCDKITDAAKQPLRDRGVKLYL